MTHRAVFFAEEKYYQYKQYRQDYFKTYGDGMFCDTCIFKEENQKTVVLKLWYKLWTISFLTI